MPSEITRSFTWAEADNTHKFTQDVKEVGDDLYVELTRNNGKYARFVARGQTGTDVSKLCLTQHPGYEALLHARNQQALELEAVEPSAGCTSQAALTELLGNPIQAAVDEGGDAEPAGRKRRRGLYGADRYRPPTPTRIMVKGKEKPLGIKEPWTPMELTIEGAKCEVLKPCKASDSLWVKATVSDLDVVTAFMRTYGFDASLFARAVNYNLTGKYSRAKEVADGDESAEVAAVADASADVAVHADAPAEVATAEHDDSGTSTLVS